MSPIDQGGGQFGADKLILLEKLDDHAAEVLRHSLDIPEKDMHKPAILIEATFQNEEMKVRGKDSKNRSFMYSENKMVRFLE